MILNKWDLYDLAFLFFLIGKEKKVSILVFQRCEKKN